MHSGAIQLEQKLHVDHIGNLVPFPQLHASLHKSVQKLVVRMSHMIRVSSALFIPSFKANVDSKPFFSARTRGREHVIKGYLVDSTFRSCKNPCIVIVAASNTERNELEFDGFKASCKD